MREAPVALTNQDPSCVQEVLEEANLLVKSVNQRGPTRCGSVRHACVTCRTRPPSILGGIRQVTRRGHGVVHSSFRRIRGNERKKATRNLSSYPCAYLLPHEVDTDELSAFASEKDARGSNKRARP